MQVQIETSKVQQFANLGRYFFATLRTERQSASFAISKVGVVVCVHNASNRVWRGLGKTFSSFDAARSNYKTPSIRAMIDEVERLNREALAAEAGLSVEMVKAHNITEVA